MIAVLWLFCFCILIPTWHEVWGRFSLDTKVGSCSIIPDVHGNSPKKYLFVGGFLIPGLAIMVCYARIFIIVRQVAKKSRPTLQIRPKSEVDTGSSIQMESSLQTTSKHTSLPPKRPNNPFTCLSIPEISSTSGGDNSANEVRDKKITDSDRFFSRSSEALQKLRLALTPAPKPPGAQKLLPSKKDKKLRTLIMAIMLSFVICHLPISVTKIFLEFTTHPFVNIASYITLYLTTCINPIIYVVMSNEYRQAYKNLISCRKGDHDFADSSALRRITSMKTLASIRRPTKKLNPVNTQLPT